MNRTSLVILYLVMALTAMAQSIVYDELFKQPELMGSNSVAYPGPQQDRLTPAPKGKKPFYISHYGRHGSRYLTKTRDYTFVFDILTKASKDGKLSPLGEDVMGRVAVLASDAHERWGDLTPLGIQQHRDIIHRMIRNFPGIFKGNTHVDARSTLVPRCVLSMTSAIQQLAIERPHLQVTFDASPHDVDYMNYQDRHLIEKIRRSDAEKIYMDYVEKNHCWDHVIYSLFNDTAYVNRNIDKYDFNFYLFRLAGSIQNTERRDSITLFDLYTQEELIATWRQNNLWWYMRFGQCPYNGGDQPYTQRNLLRSLIEHADSCVALPESNVELRFGHDTMVLPLACLMDINGYGLATEQLDSIVEKGWIDYRLFPMACNIQIVFYRKNISDKDVLVKVLLNENEATLPVTTDIPPYYHWSDVRSYYLQLLDSYQEK